MKPFPTACLVAALLPSFASVQDPPRPSIPLPAPGQRDERRDGRGRFTTHHIHEDQAAYEVRLIDMGGDGDQDLLVAGQESKNVAWFESRLRFAERNHCSRR